MVRNLPRYWWAVALRGVAALLFGVLALFWPDITLLALLALFGAFALVDGIFAIGTAIFDDRAAGRRGWLAVQGVAGVAIGIATFVWPGVTTLVLLWLIAVWAVVTGVVEIITAIRLRREISGEWLLALSGALSVVFGLVLVIWPTTGALAVVYLIGIYAVMAGVVLIWLGLRLRRIHRTGSVPGFGPPVRPVTP
jgi:uncharacterized membrane protein HdeD (DUF308 family)